MQQRIKKAYHPTKAMNSLISVSSKSEDAVLVDVEGVV